jgi:hypothetical protein
VYTVRGSATCGLLRPEITIFCGTSKLDRTVAGIE